MGKKRNVWVSVRIQNISEHATCCVVEYPDNRMLTTQFVNMSKHVSTTSSLRKDEEKVEYSWNSALFLRIYQYEYIVYSRVLFPSFRAHFPYISPHILGAKPIPTSLQSSVTQFIGLKLLSNFRLPFTDCSLYPH